MSIQAMKQALEALEDPWSAGPEGVAHAITALRAAIEQAETQELTCVCGAVWEGETMVCAPRQRVCSADGVE